MLTYNMKKTKGETKTAYLYDRIREDIITNRLLANEKLPSKRALATHLGISLITVENAYAELQAEGYIYSKPRSGFFVNGEHPTPKYLGDFKEIKHLKDENKKELNKDIPIPRLKKSVKQVLTDNPGIMLQKAPHSGCAVLRNAIADHLSRYRGMFVQPEQIIIGSGAEYLYSMIAQFFGNKLIFAIEKPCYEKIEKIYRSHNIQLEHLEMGADGITSEALDMSIADILHVSPFHSYPSGVAASVSKRMKYLEWIGKKNGWLIEDDYDSEFVFFKKPTETLYTMDSSDSVIYMNSFSKSIAPGMRIAYMVLPGRLLSEYDNKMGFYSCTVPVFDQYVLAEFINSNEFERHLRRIRKILQK